MRLRYFLFIASVPIIASCVSSKAIKQKVAKIKQQLISQDSALLEKQKNGIDLIAHGSLPTEWTLEMNMDQGLVFTTKDFVAKGNSIRQEPEKITKDKDKKANEKIPREVVYTANTDVTSIEIKVINDKCENDSSNSILNKKVVVNFSYNENTYEGCGKYLYDPEINDRWMLEYIDAVEQLEYSYARGLPRMEINMTQGKMFGFDGCSEVAANIEVRGKRIKFYNIWNTRSIDCKNKLGKKLYADLVSNKLLEYSIKNDRLILYVAGDKRLIFKHPKK
ncbi:MAG: META domain-containing protein [Ferruginibacter sp.]|nr:META domain-containing protein [Ferruginibacter sp.]